MPRLLLSFLCVLLSAAGLAEQRLALANAADMTAGHSIHPDSESYRGPESGVIEGVLMATPPTIDGVIQDTVEWSEVSPFEGLTDRDLGTPAPESGRFWLAYDSQYIYFAARVVDSSPGSIAANEYRQNVSLSGDDHIALLLDPFGTLSDFNSFSMNARGATGVQIAGGRAAKLEWLGEFLAKGRVTSDGWEVEARIPWKLMKLPSASTRTLRFNVRRYKPRTQRYYVWRYVSGENYDNYGNWDSVQVPEVPVERSLKLLPYGYVGGDTRSKAIFNGGLDMKSQISDQIELVGSISPDFRNIENQILSLDFSYFERLTGETRPFFQEGGQYFQMGYDQRIFASQRVRRFDAGVKTYGKLSEDSTFGLLNTTDFGSQNVLVGSVYKKMDKRTDADVGFAVLNERGKENQAFKASWGRSLGSWQGYVSSMFTNDQVVGSGWRNNGGMYYERKGLASNLEFVEVTRGFYPRLGFSPERDFRGFNGGIESQRSYSKGYLAETEVGLWGYNYWRLDGRPYRRNASLNVSFTGRDGLDFDLHASQGRYERFDDEIYSASLERPRSEPYRQWEVEYSWGRLSGLRYQSYGVSANYRPLARLQVSLSGQRVKHRGTETQTILSANYDFGQNESVGGRAVRVDGKLNWYLSYRRSGGQGAEYFLIVGDPNARDFQSRVILKAVWPFELNFGRRSSSKA